jgi:hypothetical protein
MMSNTEVCLCLNTTTSLDALFRRSSQKGPSFEGVHKGHHELSDILSHLLPSLPYTTIARAVNGASDASFCPRSDTLNGHTLFSFIWTCPPNAKRSFFPKFSAVAVDEAGKDPPPVRFVHIKDWSK